MRTAAVYLCAIVLLAVAGLRPAAADQTRHASVCREARPVGDFAALSLDARSDSELQARAVVYRERDGAGIAFLYLDQHARRVLQYRATADARDHAAFRSPYGSDQHRIDATVLQYMKPVVLPKGYLLRPCG